MGRARTLGLAGAALTAALVPLTAFSAGPAGRESKGPPAIVECAGAGAIDFDCYQRRYHAMVARKGARAAIRDLSERSTRVGYVRAACHQLMHGIGRAAGARSARSSAWTRRSSRRSRGPSSTSSPRAVSRSVG